MWTPDRLRIFLTKSFVVICVRLHYTDRIARYTPSAGNGRVMEPLYIFREPTLGPNLAMHTIFLPESWIFRFCEEYP